MSEQFLISPTPLLNTLLKEILYRLNNHPMLAVTYEKVEHFCGRFQMLFSGEYRSIKFEKSLLHRCIMEYCKCVLIFIKDNLDKAKKDGVDYLNRWLSVLDNLGGVDSIKNKFIFIMPILENLIYEDLPLWVKKEFIVHLNRIFEKPTQLIFNEKEKNFFFVTIATWMKLLITCGDYEFQTILVEAIISTCELSDIKEVLRSTFGEKNIWTRKFLEVYRKQNYVNDLNTLLIAINDSFNHVHSVPCLKVTLEETVIPPLKGMNPNAAWMHVNYGFRTLSFSCHRDALRSLPGSANPSNFYEFVTVNFEDVGKICLLINNNSKTLNSIGGMFLISLTGKCSCRFNSSKDIVYSIKKISLTVPHGSDLQFLKETFTNLFGKKFKEDSNIPIKKRNVLNKRDSPLTSSTQNSSYQAKNRRTKKCNDLTMSQGNFLKQNAKLENSLTLENKEYVLEETTDSTKSTFKKGAVVYNKETRNSQPKCINNKENENVDNLTAIVDYKHKNNLEDSKSSENCRFFISPDTTTNEFMNDKKTGSIISPHSTNKAKKEKGGRGTRKKNESLLKNFEIDVLTTSKNKEMPESSRISPVLTHTEEMNISSNYKFEEDNDLIISEENKSTLLDFINNELNNIPDLRSPLCLKNKSTKTKTSKAKKVKHSSNSGIGGSSSTKATSSVSKTHTESSNKESQLNDLQKKNNKKSKKNAGSSNKQGRQHRSMQNKESIDKTKTVNRLLHSSETVESDFLCENSKKSEASGCIYLKKKENEVIDYVESNYNLRNEKKGRRRNILNMKMPDSYALQNTEEIVNAKKSNRNKNSLSNERVGFYKNKKPMKIDHSYSLENTEVINERVENEIVNEEESQYYSIVQNDESNQMNTTLSLEKRTENYDLLTLDNDTVNVAESEYYSINSNVAQIQDNFETPDLDIENLKEKTKIFEFHPLKKLMLINSEEIINLSGEGKSEKVEGSEYYSIINEDNTSFQNNSEKPNVDSNFFTSANIAKRVSKKFKKLDRAKKKQEAIIEQDKINDVMLGQQESEYCSFNPDITSTENNMVTSGLLNSESFKWNFNPDSNKSIATPNMGNKNGRISKASSLKKLSITNNSFTLKNTTEQSDKNEESVKLELEENESFSNAPYYQKSNQSNENSETPDLDIILSHGTNIISELNDKNENMNEEISINNVSLPGSNKSIATSNMGNKNGRISKASSLKKLSITNNSFTLKNTTEQCDKSEESVKLELEENESFSNAPYYQESNQSNENSETPDLDIILSHGTNSISELNDKNENMNEEISVKNVSLSGSNKSIATLNMGNKNGRISKATSLKELSITNNSFTLKNTTEQSDKNEESVKLELEENESFSNAPFYQESNQSNENSETPDLDIILSHGTNIISELNNKNQNTNEEMNINNVRLSAETIKINDSSFRSNIPEDITEFMSLYTTEEQMRNDDEISIISISSTKEIDSDAPTEIMIDLETHFLENQQTENKQYDVPKTDTDMKKMQIPEIIQDRWKTQNEGDDNLSSTELDDTTTKETHSESFENRVTKNKQIKNGSVAQKKTENDVVKTNTDVQNLQIIDTSEEIIKDVNEKEDHVIIISTSSTEGNVSFQIPEIIDIQEVSEKQENKDDQLIIISTSSNDRNISGTELDDKATEISYPENVKSKNEATEHNSFVEKIEIAVKYDLLNDHSVNQASTRERAQKTKNNEDLFIKFAKNESKGSPSSVDDISAPKEINEFDVDHIDFALDQLTAVPILLNEIDYQETAGTISNDRTNIDVSLTDLLNKHQETSNKSSKGIEELENSFKSMNSKSKEHISSKISCNERNAFVVQNKINILSNIKIASPFRSKINQSDNDVELVDEKYVAISNDLQESKNETARLLAELGCKTKIIEELQRNKETKLTHHNSKLNKVCGKKSVTCKKRKRTKEYITSKSKDNSEIFNEKCQKINSLQEFIESPCNRLPDNNFLLDKFLTNSVENKIFEKSDDETNYFEKLEKPRNSLPTKKLLQNKFNASQSESTPSTPKTNRSMESDFEMLIARNELNSREFELTPKKTLFDEIAINENKNVTPLIHELQKSQEFSYHEEFSSFSFNKSQLNQSAVKKNKRKFSQDSEEISLTSASQNAEKRIKLAEGVQLSHEVDKSKEDNMFEKFTLEGSLFKKFEHKKSTLGGELTQKMQNSEVCNLEMIEPENEELDQSRKSVSIRKASEKSFVTNKAGTKKLTKVRLTPKTHKSKIVNEDLNVIQIFESIPNTPQLHKSQSVKVRKLIQENSKENSLNKFEDINEEFGLITKQSIISGNEFNKNIEFDDIQMDEELYNLISKPHKLYKNTDKSVETLQVGRGIGNKRNEVLRDEHYYNTVDKIYGFDAMLSGLKSYLKTWKLPKERTKKRQKGRIIKIKFGSSKKAKNRLTKEKREEPWKPFENIWG